MGEDLRRVSQRAEGLFRLAEKVSGLAIGDICARGPIEALTRTEVAQVAVVTTSLAAVGVLAECTGAELSARVAAVAGHSVGEVAAMCWAGAFDEETCLRLVGVRGQLMNRDSSLVDGTMAAVIGLDEGSLDVVCADASARCGGAVVVANLNGPGQVVISGSRAAVALAGELALSAGARRVLPLRVGGPFHSPYMRQAANDFRAPLAAAPFRDAGVAVVLNTTAAQERSGDALRAELAEQIAQRVRWEGSLESLWALGCRAFIEVGSGQVLTGLARRVLPEAASFAVGDLESARRAAEFLRDGPATA
jgi:[acyl-carrier-protein] S-malonyltransferase